MGIRDREFNSLLLYAKSLGIRVTVHNKKGSDCLAFWLTDGSAINIYKNTIGNKTNLVLTLLHELGHHLDYVHTKKRNVSNRLIDAWGRENTKEKKTSLKTRKLIYNDEVAGTQWWDAIIKEVQIKIPKWRIDLQKEKDLWMYEVFVKTGDYPDNKQCKEKSKELKQKWKGKK